MRRVKSESWLGRLGFLIPRGNEEPPEKHALGVLSFEAARLMFKAVHLWHALSDDRLASLRADLRRLEGVRKLVADDDNFLFALALAEITDVLGLLSSSLTHLTRRCSDPALRRFDAAFADLVETGAYPNGFEYTGRKMERKMRKMEQFVAASARLHQEMEVLEEQEQALRRMWADPRQEQGSASEFERKVAWQRQQVKYLREGSLWVRSYDYVVRLLSRALFSIVGRMRQIFGFQVNKDASKWYCDRKKPAGRLARSHSINGLASPSPHSSYANETHMFSGPLIAAGQCLHGEKGLLPPPPSRKPRTKSSASPRSCIPLDNGIRKASVTPLVVDTAEEANPEAKLKGENANLCLSWHMIDPRFRLLNPPSSTLGAAALALRYANVILVIEKLAASPHLISPDARVDLYSALTASIKAELRARLKLYAKSLASCFCNPALAAGWRAAVARILEWLAPLAHNMVRWQAERGFEQQGLVSTSGVLLLQTLYYADQQKSEEAITELLVGLNYLWRFEQELGPKAIMECGSSRNFDNKPLFQLLLDDCSSMQ